LFERGLDPDKRSQQGAHYTDPDTIMRIVEPVVLAPWERAWEAEKAALAAQIEKAKKKVSEAAKQRYRAFLERLTQFRVLDPSCGSGNFLYIALRGLKDFEKRVHLEAEEIGLPREFPRVGPESVLGLEVNPYAAELARVTVWIGEIQWMLAQGFGFSRNPILRPLDQIACRDALLNEDGSEAAWPKADVIIGNPPFLGDKKILGELGEDYAGKIRTVFEGRVPVGADLVLYWFEKARCALAAGNVRSVGLVATNSIRGGQNRKVLDAIARQHKIFNIWSDELWINEGAAVRVSLVCFTGKNEDVPLMADGAPAAAIYADLTATRPGASAFDLTKAHRLAENAGVAFIGIQKNGPFDIPGETARQWLALPNPHGRPNSDVLRPWVNGADLTRRGTDTWLIDFGGDTPLEQAALYERPFAHVEEHVKPTRVGNKDPRAGTLWWLHKRSNSDLREALEPLVRYIVTPRVAKHRVFVWRSTKVIPDSAVAAIASDNDVIFGILQSRLHERWSLRLGTSLEDRPRYTPTSAFETFPFPDGMAPSTSPTSYATDPRAMRIAAAAARLNDLRENWLNPRELVERVPEVVQGYPDRLVSASEAAAIELKRRTLTNLYNANPVWLQHAHRELDEAVAAAYGWEWPLSEDEMLMRLFALNQQRAGVLVELTDPEPALSSAPARKRRKARVLEDEDQDD
jgi:type II restriction/modification system DNA methylase subunit YeeA